MNSLQSQKWSEKEIMERSLKGHCEVASKLTGDVQRSVTESPELAESRSCLSTIVALGA